MPEALLHYIWQSKLFADYQQVTTDGRRVEVINVGQHNLHAGPDFTNVRLRIYNPADDPTLCGQDYVELVGNVEMHVESSDWYKHGHQQDRAYDTVVLHVVRHADKPVYTTTGKPISQLELRYPEPEDYISQMLTRQQPRTRVPNSCLPNRCYLPTGGSRHCSICVSDVRQSPSAEY